MVVRLDCGRITDWESFRSVFAEVLGFPAFYGRNMDAWIDCVSWLDEPGSGMTTVAASPGGVVTLQLDGVDEFAVRWGRAISQRSARWPPTATPCGTGTGCSACS
jgi:hypothetical protein